MTYKVKMTPHTLEDMPRYVEEELIAIENVLGVLQTPELLRLRKLNVEPVEKGNSAYAILAYADGVNWNPGSGAGIYASNGSTWTLVAGL